MENFIKIRNALDRDDVDYTTSTVESVYTGKVINIVIRSAMSYTTFKVLYENTSSIFYDGIDIYAIVKI